MRNIVLVTLMFFSAALPVRANGDAPSVFQKAMEVYVQNASFLIRNNIDWHMVRTSDAEAVVVIRFNPNGTFMAAKIEERSGNPTFDVALESAVRRSIPMLPPPPIPPGASAPLSIPMRFRVQR
jgi:TonB family protein